MSARAAGLLGGGSYRGSACRRILQAILGCIPCGLCVRRYCFCSSPSVVGQALGHWPPPHTVKGPEIDGDQCPKTCGWCGGW